MRIVQEYPPNIDLIKANFNIVGKDIVFAYGDTIYSPAGLSLSQDLIVHEMKHIEQQKGEPDDWWDLYISNSDFRLEQEVEAYKAQLQSYKGDRYKLAWKLAKDLSSETYGNLVSIEEALNLILK